MHHAVLLLLLLLLLLQLPLATTSLRSGSAAAEAAAAPPATTASGNTSCAAPESCGNLTIRYPFSLSGAQPLYCGYPVYDLVCDAGPGRAYLSRTFRDRLFRVASIDYVSNTLVAAVQTTFDGDGDGDCRIPDFNVSSGLSLYLLNVSAANKHLVFFYDCAVPPQLRLPAGSCANHTIGAYLADRPGDAPPQGVPSNCTSVSVPVRHGMQPAHQYYQQLISDGFLLELPLLVGDCDACRQRGGECRFVGLEFHCVCSDDGTLCPNSTQSNSTFPPDNSNKDELGIKIVAGITVGVLLLTILGIVCLLKLRSWMRLKQRRSASLDDLIHREGTPAASLRKEFSLAAGSPGTHIFTYEELHDATDGFSDAREIGVGGFGMVYKGTLPDGSLVAVKRLYKNSYKGVEQFLNEVGLLSRLRHPNLVTLYGCSSSGYGTESARYRSSAAHDLLLVYEFVPNGTLASHLHLHGPALLAWPARLAIAVETASALDYLHARQVVHRDVKTNNILLDAGFHVKVADFGLSRLFPADATHVSTAPQGTPGYVDPVYHRRYQLTDKSDVYSFGVVLVELISSRPAVDMSRPGADVNLASMAVHMIQCCEIDQLADPRLGYGSSAPSSSEATKRTVDIVAEVAFRCLQPEQDVRPAISEVLDVLRDAQNWMEKAKVDVDAPSLKKSSDGSPDTVMQQWISPSTTTSTNNNST